MSTPWKLFFAGYATYAAGLVVYTLWFFQSIHDRFVNRNLIETLYGHSNSQSVLVSARLLVISECIKNGLPLENEEDRTLYKRISDQAIHQMAAIIIAVTMTPMILALFIILF